MTGRYRERTRFDTFAEIIAVLFCVWFILSCWAALIWIFSVTMISDDVVPQKNTTGCVNKTIAFYVNVTLDSVSNISTTEAVTNESLEYSYDEYDSTTLESISNISTTEVATTNVSSELFQNEYS